MSGQNLLTIPRAVQCLRDGELIAYPTEAVFGLGCDPANEKAVRALLALKDRSADAGLILIGSEFEQFEPFIKPVNTELKNQAMASWPGPVTWLFPRSAAVPDWLAGKYATVAIRVTDHPVCRALCAAFGGAIVSTSANPGQKAPARSSAAVDAYFGSALCGIVAGELGNKDRPSEIRDLATGRVLRKG